MSSNDDDIDLYPIHQTGIGYQAGVTQYDSKAVADYKVGQHQMKQWQTALDNTQSSSAHSTPVVGGGGGFDLSTLLHLFLFLLVAFFVVAGVAVVKDGYPKWKDAWLQKRYDDAIVKVAQDRIAEYSDFSKPSDWPQDIQGMYRKNEGTPLEDLLEAAPERFMSLPAAQQTELGAQVWFRVASKGRQATQYLTEVQAAPHRKKGPVLRAGGMSLRFLRDQCAKGVEVACLDAAKVWAGLVFNGVHGFDEAVMDQHALKELPSQGALANAPGIRALRQKLSEPLADTAARRDLKTVHFEMLSGQTGVLGYVMPVWHAITQSLFSHPSS